MVAPIPEGTEGRINPYLMVDGAAAAIDFYVEPFGATEGYRLEMPDGKIAHADITVNGARVYLADAPDDMEGDAANPAKLGGTTVLMHQHVEDVDALAKRASGAGAKVLREPADQFYGDRSSVVEDPFGHQWSFHTHVRDVSPEEIATEAAKMGSG